MTPLKSRLDELRKRAARLETRSAERIARLEQVGRNADRFLESLPARPVYGPPGPRDEALEAFSVSESPASLEEALDVMDRYVSSVGHNLGSSRFFAYIPSGGLYASALADFLAAAVNRYSGVGAAAPGAARLETSMLRWLARVVGYPETAEGDLTSGGSMATLSAVVTARESAGIKAGDIPSSVVYLTAQTHHTFRKALHIAGLGECPVREIAIDDGFRMLPSALRDVMQSDRDAGLTPWLVAASAGTTDTGAVDPLNAIADVTAQCEAWLHVDAAYGGAFALCEAGSSKLEGLDRADSLIIDPHKGFFLPGGIGVVLVREGHRLYDAYHARGDYMQDIFEDTERSPCDFSPELTRPFRALRFWLPFKMHGSDAFAAALEEKMLLARYLYERLTEVPAIEPGPPPDLSIVTFRSADDDGETNAATRALYDAICEDGRVFLTTTTIDGKYTIRIAILAYNTHIEDVDLALEIIEACAAKVRADSGRD